MATLLDANLLIALAIPEHVHSEAANLWFESTETFATCPITQGSLVRWLLREDRSAATARNLLVEIANDPRHEFWPDDLSYLDVPMNGVVGHRQVTDAYLVALARHRGGRVATFDRGLAALHPGAVELVPTT